MERQEIHAEKADVAASKQNKILLKKMLFAGIQAAGGTALAFYTCKNSPSRIWPAVYSVVAVEGTYNAIKYMWKIFRKPARNEKDRKYSLQNVATGTIIYFGSLYAFSEAWRSDNDLWMPFIGSATLGLSYAVSSTYRMRRIFKGRPLLKCCQLAFEPALLVGGTTYLLHFRNHEEERLFWYALVASGFSGFITASRGVVRKSKKKPGMLLLKAVEAWMGGCILMMSCMVSAFYVSAEEFHWSSKYFTYFMGNIGCFFIHSSFIYFLSYLGMERQVVQWLGDIVHGSLHFFMAFMMVTCMGYQGVVCAAFPIMIAGGYIFLRDAFYNLYMYLPEPVFIRYCQRVLGLQLTVGSSAALAYIGYRFGWWPTLFMMPFLPAGIYVTYRGFSRVDES